MFDSTDGHRTTDTIKIKARSKWTNKLIIAGNAYLIHETFLIRLEVVEESKWNQSMSKQIEWAQIELSKR